MISPHITVRILDGSMIPGGDDINLSWLKRSVGRYRHDGQGRAPLEHGDEPRWIDGGEGLPQHQRCEKNGGQRPDQDGQRFDPACGGPNHDEATWAERPTRAVAFDHPIFSPHSLRDPSCVILSTNRRNSLQITIVFLVSACQVLLAILSY